MVGVVREAFIDELARLPVRVLRRLRPVEALVEIAEIGAVHGVLRAETNGEKVVLLHLGPLVRSVREEVGGAQVRREPGTADRLRQALERFYRNIDLSAREARGGELLPR